MNERIKEILAKHRSKTVVLVDNLWHLYRCHYAYGNMYHNNEPTGHWFGLTRLIQTINDNYQEYIIIICEDGIPVRRKELNNNYKSNRQSSISFYKEYETEYKLLQDVPNVHFCYNEVEESDDVMYSISRIKDYNNRFIIFSGDNDLLQSIDESTVISRSIQAGRIETIDQTSTYYIDKFKDVPPSKLPILRAICGDTSDVLPAIAPRFPKNIARMYAKAWNGSELPDPENEGLYEGFEDLSKTKKEKFKIIKENQDILKQNFDMMQLRPIEVTVRDPISPEKVSEKVARELGLNQFANWLKFKGYA